MNWTLIITIAFCIGLYLWVAYNRGVFPFKKKKKPNTTTAPGIILPPVGQAAGLAALHTPCSLCETHLKDWVHLSDFISAGS